MRKEAVWTPSRVEEASQHLAVFSVYDPELVLNASGLLFPAEELWPSPGAKTREKLKHRTSWMATHHLNSFKNKILMREKKKTLLKTHRASKWFTMQGKKKKFSSIFALIHVSVNWGLIKLLCARCAALAPATSKLLLLSPLSGLSKSKVRKNL